MVNIKFPFYKYSKEELKELKNKFMPGWEDVTNYGHWSENHRVIQSPSKRIYNLEDCLRIASEDLEVGNRRQIAALKSLDFFNYLYNIHSDKI